MVLSMERWKGKVAIVTGASSGIGAAIAVALVEAGLKVAGLARRKEKLDELSKKLAGKAGQLYPIKADVTKEDDILDAFKWVKNNLGPIHILINNAGIALYINLIDGETQLLKDILNTNVLGLSIATREAVKDMRENEVDGHIVHINSILGHKVALFSGMYPASKFAVTALTETLRQELNTIGSKIKITSISPGVVDTEIWGVSGIKNYKKGTEQFKLCPQLQSEDIADSVVYVLSTPPDVQVHELTIKPVGEPV